MANNLVKALRDFAQDLRKDAHWAAAAVYVGAPLMGGNPFVAGLSSALVYGLFKAAPVLVELFVKKG